MNIFSTLKGIFKTPPPAFVPGRLVFRSLVLVDFSTNKEIVPALPTQDPIGVVPGWSIGGTQSVKSKTGVQPGNSWSNSLPSLSGITGGLSQQGNLEGYSQSVMDSVLDSLTGKTQSGLSSLPSQGILSTDYSVLNEQLAVQQNNYQNAQAYKNYATVANDPYAYPLQAKNSPAGVLKYLFETHNYNPGTVIPVTDDGMKLLKENPQVYKSLREQLEGQYLYATMKGDTSKMKYLKVILDKMSLPPEPGAIMEDDPHGGPVPLITF